MQLPNCGLRVLLNGTKLAGTVCVIGLVILKNEAILDGWRGYIMDRVDYSWYSYWWDNYKAAVDLVVLTLSTIHYVLPSHNPLVFKSRPPSRMLVPNCSLMVFCSCTKLVGTLHVIQIRFLLACCWSEQSCTYSINHTLRSSIPYSSSFQI
jgi:hypothetical protein